METFKKLQVLLFESQTELNKWLSKNCNQSNGIWLKIAKKNSDKTSVSYNDAVEEALCYGWIDGQIYSYDEDYYIQKFTPRGPKSTWSKINVGKVEDLVKQGRMRPNGMTAVNTAKENGAWQAAYDSASKITIPEDFQNALNVNPKAKKFFETLDKANIYSFYWRIQTAKTPKTRKARLDTFIAMLERGEKLH